MLRDPDSHVVQQAYARWAPVYDALCGPVFLNGRRAAATAARNVGGRILEIGVGTGLSFEDYDATTEIVGIDISEPMIARARERTKSGRYPFVKELAVMDAHELAYEDGSFDCVVGQFVITLVEDPERVLSECARVVRPGGQIILVNHLYSERGLIAAVERLLAQRARKLGLRPEFPFQRLAAWAQTHGGAELIESGGRSSLSVRTRSFVFAAPVPTAHRGPSKGCKIGKQRCHITETGRWYMSRMIITLEIVGS
jgi:phosphatidylethanolamine/phosphatidyl-N-methylethanolamine N-methyltransferase